MMERIMSVEDRIRRAEEIYSRRRQDINPKINIRSSNINKSEKVKLSLFKKLFLQIGACLIIYFLIFLIKNSNYYFSSEFIENIKHFLDYDIDFNSAYINVINYYDNNIKPLFYSKNNENIDTNEIEKNTDGEILVNEEVLSQSSLEETKEVMASAVEVKEEPLSQMEIDALDIKNNYSLIIPLKGVISSRYGPRTPTEIVSANHKGIDIAVNEGTVFVAAMDGKVTTASSYGSYGNHIFIQNGDVITVYAHCKKLYVKEGDIVVKGQNLGEVGQTRKCYRTTFTF